MQSENNNMSSRRFKEPGDATKELYEGFNDWCAILTKHSIEAALAVIAANWAVHGSTDVILTNRYSKWSMAAAIGFLGINLAITGWITMQYNSRRRYADDDKNRWAREYEAAGKLKASSWPYTCFMEWLGSFLRFLKVVIPFVSAILFILSLFLKN